MLGAALLGLAAAPARADDAALCLAAAEDAARLSGVPFDVLHALALTETGRGDPARPWPWAVNADGEGHWFATREEAVAFAEGRLAAGQDSFDVGCFQLNWRWHREGFVSVAQMFDPLANATYAAAYLRSHREEGQGWAEAAGAYHSRTPEHAARYRARFEAHLAALGGGTGEAPLALAQARTGAPPGGPDARAAFPLLRAAEGPPRLGSLVPLDG